MQIRKNFINTKTIQQVCLRKKMHKNATSNKKKQVSISKTLSGVILHARLFVTGQLQNPSVL